MEIRCTNCGTVHTPNDSEKKLIASDMPFVMLNCNKCGLGFGLDRSKRQSEIEIVWRCPNAGCEGFVSFVEDEDDSFYGCGEDGTVWKSRTQFFDAIESIVDKYPHRLKCYIRNGKEWTPNPNEPSNLEEHIKEEKK